MQYMLMFHESAADLAQRTSPADAPAYWGAWNAYIGALGEAGVIVSGNGLQPPHTATRVSVALAGATWPGALSAIWWPAAWVAVAALGLAVTLLNLNFYRYFAARLGFLSTLRVVPLHWLYFWYCGFSAVAGAILHHLSGEGGARPAAWPYEFEKQMEKAQ